MRALRALLFVIISTMILIIFAPKVLPICKHFWPTAEALPVILDKSLSAAVGFLLAFVFARVIAVVQSDVDITDLQAENLTLSAAKRQGDHTEKVISSGSTVASTGTERYGRLFQ